MEQRRNKAQQETKHEAAAAFADMQRIDAELESIKEQRQALHKRLAQLEQGGTV